MLVAESRPRTLSWLHSGPLLFGDWGTSRLYVLGLAFYFTGHASIYYLGVMSLIMAAVAWGYTIVCRCFPDGGGVYSAARRVSPLLAVIAATLLICDFIVTAALSAVEAFHYLGVESKAVIVSASIGTIFVLGVVNWLGARSAGRLALVIAVAAILMSAFIGIMCIPLLPEGLRTAKPTVDGVESAWKMWESLVRIVLALAGVEAVASMTGLMKQPVERTAKRTIWPVLFEVILLNMIFGIAINALPGRIETTTPDFVRFQERMGLTDGLQPRADATPEQLAAFEAIQDQTPEVLEYRQTAVKVLADHAATRIFGESAGDAIAMVSGVVFGLLLLSAVNTAIMAMVSVFYALGKDRELPQGLTKLNYSGVPWVGLVLSCLFPALVLVFVHDDKALSELYAIGVVGAIAINMLCCWHSKELPIGPWERRGLLAIGILMTAIGLTIVYAKPHAAYFAGSIIVGVLIARFFVRRAAAASATREPLPTPAAGWLQEIKDASRKLPASKARIMLAARGRDNAEFAVDLARRRQAALFTIYVRTLRMLDVQPGQIPRLEDDPAAQEALGTVATIARRAGVPFFPIYVTATDIADEILDYTVTFGCDTLIMGKSRRTLFSRRIAGDVLARVQDALPEGISLVTRSVSGQGPVPNSEGTEPESDSEQGHSPS
jgi:amino acid transporter/nucleotide-binding universal stress UspA family protein